MSFKPLFTALLLAPALAISAVPSAELAAAQTETGVISLFHAKSAALTGADLDEWRYETAGALEKLGTTKSLPLLSEIETATPASMVLEEGCKQPMLVPSWAFASEAHKAALSIATRSLQAKYDAALADGDLSFVGEALKHDPGTAEAEALFRAIRSASEENRQELRDVLVTQDGQLLPQTRGRAAVLTWLAEDQSPPPDVFSRLTPSAALWALEAGEALPPAQRNTLLAEALAHPATASAARLAMGRPAGEPAKELISTSGPEGSLLVARSATADDVSQLSTLLGDSAADLAMRRSAALALMLNGSAGAKRALSDALASGRVPAEFADDVEGFLH